MGPENSPEADWAHNPPYKSINERPDFDKKLEASCHCGRARYWLSREQPLATKYCHCRDCQILHGALLP